jgi:hypothetical protein
MGGPMRPPPRNNMLQQRADQRRRDEDDIIEMRQLLAEYSGQEIDDVFMEAFSRGLAEETGALPPPRIVVEAIKESKSAEPRRIADAVRAYYRRPRPQRPGNEGVAPQAARQPVGAEGASSESPAEPQVPGEPQVPAEPAAESVDAAPSESAIPAPTPA